MVHPEAPFSSRAPWVKCRENSRGQRPKKGSDGGGKGGWKGEGRSDGRGAQAPSFNTPLRSLGEDTGPWASSGTFGAPPQPWVPAGNWTGRAQRPLTFYLRLILGLQPPLPAQLPVRGHGSRAAAPSSPAATTRGSRGSATSTLHQPRPAPPPAQPRGRGDPGLAMPSKDACGGPTELGPCLPSRWALGHTWAALCPELSCHAARAGVRAPKCPASWHPLAADLPPLQGCLATTATQHSSQHGHWLSTLVAAPGPGLP